MLAIITKKTPGFDSVSHVPRHALLRRLSIVFALLVAHGAHAADGNELFAYGAVQKGLGGAGVAHALDSTWVILNPAAIIELKERADFSLELMRLHVELEPRGLPLAANYRAGRMSDTSVIGIPAMGYVRPLGRGMLGLGLFGTQGNRLDYPYPRSSIALLGNGDRRSQYEVVKIPMVYALPLSERWTFGIGLVPTAARFRTDSLTLRLLEAEANNGSDFEGGGGIMAGLHWRGERLRLGAVYHSRVWMGSYEDYRRDLLKDAFNLPQKLQVGMAWSITPRVEMFADYKWIDWSSIAQLGRRTVDGGLGWEPQHLLKAGVNWQMDSQWTLRAGVSHGNSPIPESFIFANALTPGIGKTTLAFGISRRIGERHEIHAAISHALTEEARESGVGDFFSILGRGTGVEYRESSVTIQYGYRF